MNREHLAPSHSPDTHPHDAPPQRAAESLISLVGGADGTVIVPPQWAELRGTREANSWTAGVGA